jgi:mannose/cellobiose epimerase-like protein (N-acyl-D-glucosamine 2-epimerase family)
MPLDAVHVLDFATGSRLPAGFGYLDRRGRLDTTRPLHCLINARMTYVFSVASAICHGSPGPRINSGLYGELALHGIQALTEIFHDREHGGFITTDKVSTGRKTGYIACFVALAASTAVAVGIDDARALTDLALENIDRHFWSEADGAMIDSWDSTFGQREPYWGANTNMHAVEAFLAVHTATGDLLWRDRAARIAERFIATYAADAAWLLPEHYRDDWTVDHDYNRERPQDEFRPYGVTIGHLFEWSRLLLELSSSYQSPPNWLADAARALYRSAATGGWRADGHDGFPYTVDFDGSVVADARTHWAHSEAIAAAATQYRFTGDPAYADDLKSWQEYADRRFVDHVNGSWHHTLDRDGKPTAAIEAGKPDAYHAFQACVLPSLPVAPSLAARVSS